MDAKTTPQKRNHPHPSTPSLARIIDPITDARDAKFATKNNNAVIVILLQSRILVILSSLSQSSLFSCLSSSILSLSDFLT